MNKFIYVAENDDRTMLKIGISCDPERRVRLMVMPNGKTVKMKLLALFGGDRRDEIAVHDQFRWLNLAGREWYRYSAAILEFFASRQEHPPTSAFAEARSQTTAVCRPLPAEVILAIRAKALVLASRREQVEQKEYEFRRCLNKFLRTVECKEFAKQMSISPQYLSDIRYGRRLVSDEFVDRLCGKNGARR